MYLEFQLYTDDEYHQELWDTCCYIKDCKIEVEGLIIENGHVKWMYENMRHSGVHKAIDFMVNSADEFQQMMLLYDELKRINAQTRMRFTNNCLTINDIPKD